MTYDDALKYIIGLLDGPRPSMPAGQRLERMAWLLRALDLAVSPHAVVLVAGTKGKGSTATMLASIVSAAGRRVGLYTKPHVSDYRERIRLDGVPVPPDTLVRLVERATPAVEDVARGPGGRPTYFEVSLALALRYFADERVDLAVVEVGVGGRFDAANALDPALSIITPISRDHTEQLGMTVDAIARHKAGIMRPGRPVVVAPQGPVADAALLEVHRSVGARLVRVVDAARWTPGTPADGGDAFELRTAQTSHGRLILGMRGRHQVVNAATAVVAVETLLAPGAASAGVVARGLRGAVLPGRFECLDRRPAVVLDVAHNPASMTALRDALDEYYPGRGVVLVFGMLATHNPVETASLIARRARMAVVTQPPDPRAFPADELAAVLRRELPAVEVAPDATTALGRAFAEARADEVVCVTGSVYLVGEVRDRLISGRSSEGTAVRRVG